MKSRIIKNVSQLEDMVEAVIAQGSLINRHGHFTNPVPGQMKNV
jgi:hypothetical protein